MVISSTVKNGTREDYRSSINVAPRSNRTLQSTNHSYSKNYRLTVTMILNFKARTKLSPVEVTLYSVRNYIRELLAYSLWRFGYGKGGGEVELKYFLVFTLGWKRFRLQFTLLLIQRYKQLEPILLIWIFPSSVC